MNRTHVDCFTPHPSSLTPRVACDLQPLPTGCFKEEDPSMPLRGQGLLEYGLIISLVAIMAIAALIIFGPAIGDLLSGVSGSV